MASDTAPVAGTTTLFKTADLRLFHKNPRKGNVDDIAGSLRAHGQYTPIIANIGTHTGRPYEVLAGNHTLLAFRQLSELNPFDTAWRMIKVLWWDLTEEQAEVVVVADNQTFELGEGVDEKLVFEMLQDLGTTEGTGYTDADLDHLDALFKTKPEDLNEEPEGSSEPEPPDLVPHEPSAIGYTLTFDDEGQQDVWFAFVKKLNVDYPDLETVGERLLAHLAATESERV